MVLLVLVVWLVALLIGLPWRMDCILKHFDGCYEWEDSSGDQYCQH